MISFRPSAGVWVALLMAMVTFRQGAVAEAPVKEPGAGAQPLLAGFSEASLIFRELPNRQENDGRIGLQVFIRVKNTGDGVLAWPATPTSNVEAELLDAKGKPVDQTSEGANLSSGIYRIQMPPGSAIEWLVSQDGILLSKTQVPSYTLCVGGLTWRVPVAEASSYTLHLKVIKREVHQRGEEKEVLIDVPAQKIEITRG